MTAERSPWAQPDTEFVVPGPAIVVTPDPSGASTTDGSDRPEFRSGRPEFRSGRVTRLGKSLGGVTPAGRDSVDQNLAGDVDPGSTERRALRRYLVVAAGILVIGLVVLVGAVVTGHRPTGGGLLAKTFAGPPDTRGDLAKLCPPPSDGPDRPRREVPPPPAGPRTVDADAGISYAAYGDPWQIWDQVWSGGDLKVTYRVGQHFVTEPGPDRTGYHASILSGSVPATVNDALTLDLKCTGQQVAADVRTQYYFQPNTAEQIRDEFATIGGLSAWVSVFRLHFSRSGLKAKDELAAVVLFDVGRPEAAILYVSIPGTHHEWDHVVNEVIDSVRPT